MTSTRLPGKVLMDVEGAPLIEREVAALERATTLDEIVVATTTNRDDDVLVDVVERLGLRWFRGSEHDVLSRYCGAASEARADVVVRVTADCPLLDPGVVDRVVGALQPNTDYASNVLERTFAVGLDTEALHFDVLVRLDRTAQSAASREHVTWFIREERPSLFLTTSVVDDEDNSDVRVTVDTQSDLEAVRRLFRSFGGGVPPSYRQVVASARALARDALRPPRDQRR
jgi:spore coat polysaccharide biosynthesis protein SpsF